MLRRVVLATGLLLCLGGVTFARYIQWKPSEVPPVSLHDALLLAEKEVEDEKVKYHCIGASLAKTFSGGDWELRFHSPDGRPLWVSVGSDKRVRVSAEGFDY